MRRKILVIFTIFCIGLLPKTIFAETYDGEYSIDYLLRNYSLVTLGNQNINQYPTLNYYSNSANNIGDMSFENMNNTQIEGAVLINGNLNNTYTYNNPQTIVGTQAGNTKSFIKGGLSNNVNINSPLVTNINYIDFNKLYENVTIESQLLAESSTHNINSSKIEISSPGIYTINNSANIMQSSNNIAINTLLIKNYNRNGLYVFNYYNEYIDYNCLPNINVMESGSSNATPLYEYVHNGNYTGNVIFNFPNAISIIFGQYTPSHYYGVHGLPTFIGNVIAPKAKVLIGRNNYYENNTYLYSSIIANSITSGSGYSIADVLKNTKYTVNKKIVENNDNEYLKEVHDYTDDVYRRDYSIRDLLKNYSLVTLGHKSIDSKSKLLELGNIPGSVKMFHITGQALIAGDLYGKVYENEDDSYYMGLPKFDRTAFDLESNEVTESYIKGHANLNVNVNSYGYTGNYLRTVIQPWDNMSSDNIYYGYQKNNLFLGRSTNNDNISYWGNNGTTIGPGTHTAFVDNYINFDRLYSNVVAEQKEIEEGTSITPSNGKAHIRVGGSYVIDNINDVDEIIFDNFDDNKNKITVITIKNSGDINFPLISKDTGSYKGIVTNDYFGKEQATHLYEQDTFTQDTYFGNIVWNIPNATYIKLKEGAPFAGHLIAPNADVDTPELHFAGCFIVNSIYGEGNTEAHFYPLTSTATYEVPEYDNLNSSEVQRLNNLRLKRLLGGKASTIETNIIGDEEQFRKDEVKLNDIIDREEAKTSNNLVPIIDILQNPLTKRSILIVFVILTIIGVTLYKTYKKKS